MQVRLSVDATSERFFLQAAAFLDEGRRVALALCVRAAWPHAFLSCVVQDASAPTALAAWLALSEGGFLDRARAPRARSRGMPYRKSGGPAAAVGCQRRERAGNTEGKCCLIWRRRR
ncbi:unnamed protein product, partial [Phaeothamnion confervicola]